MLTALAMTKVNAQEPTFSQNVVEGKTTVTIADMTNKARIDDMIYGQMLEDCNDAVVYGGIVDNDGTENMAVTAMLERLRIPVMRWPAGTAIYDYEWTRGVGPQRTPQKELIWGGTEYYTFGTDEFIAWCDKVGTVPYINIPMGNNNAFDHSLQQALNWVEYVNGSVETPMGAYRSRNGHQEPYGVSLFCLGNENYLANRFHKSESADEYATLLHDYAKAVKEAFPQTSLLGVGHTGSWNKTVMERCGEYLDYLTMHYYMTAQVKDGLLLSPELTLFAPELVEANLRLFIEGLKDYNTAAGRAEHPIRLSIDEWNCRHSVFNGTGYSFSRKDARRLYDAAAMAGMLNVFIRTSPHVGMANYIFPVNGHGLVKTVGSQDAYPSVCYYLYQLYRRHMTGEAIGASVTGPGMKDFNLSSLKVEGDTDSSLKGQKADLCFVDCAATLNYDGMLAVAIVNRSFSEPQEVVVNVPDGFSLKKAYIVTGEDACDENTEEDRSLLRASMMSLTTPDLVLAPCATAILLFEDTSTLIDAIGKGWHDAADGSDGLTGERKLYTLAGSAINSTSRPSQGIYVMKSDKKGRKVAAKSERAF